MVTVGLFAGWMHFLLPYWQCQSTEGWHTCQQVWWLHHWSPQRSFGIDFSGFPLKESTPKIGSSSDHISPTRKISNLFLLYFLKYHLTKKDHLQSPSQPPTHQIIWIWHCRTSAVLRNNQSINSTDSRQMHINSFSYSCRINALINALTR